MRPGPSDIRPRADNIRPYTKTAAFSAYPVKYNTVALFSSNSSFFSTLQSAPEVIQYEDHSVSTARGQ